MKKQIHNLSDYLDYRILLNDDYLARTLANHNYSLRAYARDLDVSPGFLSDVFRGKKNLSLETSRKIFSKLGFIEDEMNYLDNLVKFKNSDKDSERQEAFSEINKIYNQVLFKDEPDQVGFLKSVLHFAVYGICRRVSSKEKLLKLAGSLEIPEEKCCDILEDLVKSGDLKIDSSAIEVVDRQLTVKTHDNIVPIIREFADLLMRHIETHDGIQVPSQVAHGLVLGLDEESFQLAVEGQKHLIHLFHRLAQSSKDPTYFVMYSDQFVTLKTH